VIVPQRVLASTHFLATPLGSKYLAIMADPSNSSDMTALEGLPEDQRKGIDINILTVNG
jgi:hypothetical protein